MKIIIGLGNPEKEYEQTKHNFGFLTIDALKKTFKESFSEWELNKDLESEISKGSLNSKDFKNFKKETKIFLAKPQTFMNNSGRAIKKLFLKLKFKTSNVVVIHDDVDIPFGSFKISYDKSSAGHKGVESIIKILKSQKFWRLRLGIQNPNIKKREPAEKLVLKKFSKIEEKDLNKIIKKAVESLMINIANNK